ncbi:diguanylate cyclase [Cellulomonas hominis]
MAEEKAGVAPADRFPVPPEAILDALPDAVYVIDEQRRIRAWNQAAAALTGYAAQDVLGRVCNDRLLNHVDEDGRSLCGSRCPLRATMVDGRSRQARVFLHHADGQLIPVHVQAAPLRDADGRIVAAVETFRDDTEHTRSTRKIAELAVLATHDPLTGLDNRRTMDWQLERLLDRWNRHGEAFSALLIDLDRFKHVNDTHGHDTGDRLLRAVAATLIAALGPGDIAVRFGGEEFVVLTAAADPGELTALADRLRRLIATTRADVPRGSVSVTASIGGAVIRDGDDAGELLRRADAALLRAKRSGRNRSVLTVEAPAPGTAADGAGPGLAEEPDEDVVEGLA